MESMGSGGGGWIRTNVAITAADLQSAPFSHSGTPPAWLAEVFRLRRACQSHRPSPRGRVLAMLRAWHLSIRVNHVTPAAKMNGADREGRGMRRARRRGGAVNSEGLTSPPRRAPSERLQKRPPAARNGCRCRLAGSRRRLGRHSLRSAGWSHATRRPVHPGRTIAPAHRTRGHRTRGRRPTE